MTATTSAILRQIASNLESLKTLNRPFFFSTDFWTLISYLMVSLLSSVVALSIAIGFGRYLKRRIGVKPELELVEFRPFQQQNNYWRLAIKNSGKEIAKKVQVDVTEIFEANVKRENFLSVPLRWTGINKVNRDIFPHQIAWLDVVEHFTSTGGNEVEIKTPFGGGIDDFEKLKQGKSKLTLTFYEESGISLKKEIEVSWYGIFFNGKIKGKRWYFDKGWNHKA